MNAKYVGDAKDFAKAFLFKLLRDKDRAHGLKVLPCFTSDEGGRDIRVACPTYAQLLGCAYPAGILLGDRLFSNDQTDARSTLRMLARGRETRTRCFSIPILASGTNSEQASTGHRELSVGDLRRTSYWFHNIKEQPCPS